MPKTKKGLSKKTKTEEVIKDVEAPDEDSVAIDGKTDENPEEATQENGDDSSLKKKSKGKGSKKEEAEESSNEEESASNQQNGAGDASNKKKPASKKSTKVPKPQVEPARKSTRTPKPATEEQSYEVEKLVDFRLQRGKPQYLVHWKGYTRSEDTWETESSLNCPDLLQKYQDASKRKPAKKRSASKSPSKSGKKPKQQDKDYEVEEIVGLREKNGKKEFKVRWKGYKASDDTWEPEKHLSCQDLISTYLEEHKDDVQTEDKKPAKKKVAKSKKSKKTKAK